MGDAREMPVGVDSHPSVAHRVTGVACRAAASLYATTRDAGFAAADALERARMPYCRPRPPRAALSALQDHAESLQRRFAQVVVR